MQPPTDQPNNIASSGSSTTTSKNRIRVIILLLAVAGVIFAVVAAVGISTRNQWTNIVQQRANESARTIVQVAQPEQSTGMISLRLPAQTMPYTDAPIFAQTSGYLKKWYFDIGAKVKAGDVLAEIETPEVDQELAQAKAQLNVAQAARDLAEVTYTRSQDLFKNNVIAAQDFDTAANNYAGSQSTVVVDQAKVGQLEALEAFKIVRAPFDGIVTARNTDIGAYVPAGSGIQLFRMADTSSLRVYVTVPQSFSALVKVGGKAQLSIDQFPGRQFPAQVIGTAGAINSTSKRLLTELQVPNPTGELSAGAYVQISLDIPVAAGGVMVPARTLLFQSGQPAVAIVRPDNTIEIRKVSIIRDLGARLQVSDNLPVTDQLVVNPSPALAPGTVVTVVPSTPADLSEPDSSPPNQT